MSRRFRALNDAAGIRHVPFHALRHSWATLALASGVPLKVISDNLGHAEHHGNGRVLLGHRARVEQGRGRRRRAGAPMSKRAGPAGHWDVFAPPAAGVPGLARGRLDFARSGKDSLRVVVEVRSDHRSRQVTVRQDGVEWAGGLVWAALRWSPGEGTPDLWLTWRAFPTEGEAGPGYAEVSDIVLLAKDAAARRAVKELYDALPSVGRPLGSRETTIDDLLDALPR